MLNSYELRFLNRYGQYLFSLDNVSSLQYGRKKNDEGIAVVEFPAQAYDFSLFDKDAILEIYKVNPYTGKNELQGNTCWFLRKAELNIESENEENITLTFYDTMTILTRRRIAWAGYHAPNYPSIMLEKLDSIIALIAWYNFGGGTIDPAFANSGIGGFTPAGPFSSLPPIESWQFDEYGTTIADLVNRQYPITITVPRGESALSNTHRFEFETCLKAMQDIAETAELQGESLWFDIEYTPATKTTDMQFIFKTWAGVRGVRRTTGLNRLVIGPEFKNMSDVSIIKDWTEEANIMYVGGNGEDEIKDMASVSVDYIDSPFYPIESYISENIGDGNGIHETQELINVGNIELAKKQRFLTLSGNIISKSPNEFGRDFFFGDILIGKFKTFERDVEVTEYTITVDENGEEVEIPFTSFG